MEQEELSSNNYHFKIILHRHKLTLQQRLKIPILEFLHPIITYIQHNEN
jgi:hypothetical protein